MLNLPEVPGQFWTVRYISSKDHDSGKRVVIAPTQTEAIATWLQDREADQWFLSIERTGAEPAVGSTLPEHETASLSALGGATSHLAAAGG